MGITDYTDGSLSSGFTGYRVSRTINGKQIQVYFQSHEYQSAVDKDKELSELQDRAREKYLAKKNRDAIPATYVSERYAAPRRTGVKGLAIGFQAQERCVPAQYYPCVFVTGKRCDGSRLSTSRSISARSRTLTQAWRECCKLLADVHGFDRVPPHWYASEPTPEAYTKLRRYYNKHGYSISSDTIKYLLDSADV